MKNMNVTKVLANFYQAASEHPQMTSFLALISVILNFMLKSWQIDILLFGLLIALIVIDSFTGVKLAKKKDDFSYKILKEKTMTKFLGYLIFLIALWVFTLMLFITNLRNGESFIAEYWLNVPMVLSFIFFASIEFLSIKDNIEQGYGVKTPKSFANKVQGFVDNEDISEFKNTK